MGEEEKQTADSQEERGATEDVSATHSYDLERERASLVVVSGPDAGLHVEFNDELVVGRTGESDVLIDDAGVSSRHLRFFERAAAMWVEDLDSSNGTFVNGEAVDGPRELREGDTIGIGRETLICLTVGEGGTSEAKHEHVIAVGPDANWFRVDDEEPVDLRSRGPIRRILDGLVEAAGGGRPDPMDVYELFEIGWPDIEIEPDSAAQRVYVTVRSLREQGLSGVLVTGDEGYYLATDIASIERRSEPVPPEPG